MAGNTIDFEELRVKNPLNGLIVDNPGTESLIHKAFLEALGVHVQAENVPAGINLCLSGASFDIVAINMDLPCHLGPQTAMFLREMGVRSKLIGFTGEGIEKIVEFLHAGIDYCLEKPLKIVELAAVLQQIDVDY